MGTWTNDDGLKVLFGTSASALSAGGYPDQSGDSRKLILDIDLTALTDANAAIGADHDLSLPEGALIRDAKFEVLTAGVGATAVLDIGVIKVGTDGTDDDDGFVAAEAVANLTPIGARITGAGALIGTKLDAAYHVSAGFDTAAFTAGKVRLTVEYIVTLNREDQ